VGSGEGQQKEAAVVVVMVVMMVVVVVVCGVDDGCAGGSGIVGVCGGG
jgi:hypothetical protein